MLVADPLSRLSGLRHGFFTRRGGVSGGVYASLNCALSSADSAENITSNRARAMARLGCSVDQLVSLKQIHSARAVIVDAPLGAPVEADAMVCRVPGLTLGISTADCAPVLLFDSKARVIGAAHAGWRGAAAGVIDETVRAMESIGAKASRIIGAVGPCIHQVSYEVGADLHDRLLMQDHRDRAFFRPSRRNGRYMFDLGGYVGARLDQAGVGMVTTMPYDTYADQERFFSYRRAIHGDEPDCGRQLSAIVMNG